MREGTRKEKIRDGKSKGEKSRTSKEEGSTKRQRQDKLERNEKRKE